MKKDDRLTVRERASLTLRAYDTIKRYCPGLMRAIVIKALVTAIQPLASILFSARILDEIAGGKRLGALIALAASVIAINYAVSIIKGRIDIMHSEREQQMWSYYSKVFADKQLSMDYEHIEDALIQKRKDKEKYNLFNFGNGLAQFVWTINGTIEGAVSVIVSAAMVVTLFTSASDVGAMNSPLWILAVIGSISLGMFVNSRVFKRNNALFMAWCEKAAPLDRLYGFFGFTLCKDAARAKDVRIYAQNTAAEVELRKLEEAEKGDKGYYLRYNTGEAAAAFVTGINQVLCFLFVALKAYFGAFGVGSIVRYVGALARLGDGVQKLIFGITDNAVYTIHLKHLFEFLDLPGERHRGVLPVKKPNGSAHEIAFHSVSFKYPGADTYALKNLSLTIAAGRRMAVVGMNGSGKTTMIKLLCRLYDPTEGAITLNGIDIRQYDYNEYMGILSVVFQDFKLLSFTLGQNVAASVDVDRDRAMDNLKRAGFTERIKTMPKGLDTPIYKDFEEDGVEVSGGEAQKIALARALYRDAPFIILDEPTAALDPIAELEVYTTFNDIIGDKTAIYISHRLASCRFCDDIAVFHEGELIQRGSHDELVADTGGKYYELWSAQARYYDNKHN